MKTVGTENIRNVCLVGHGGSGKTSLAEAMLFASGTVNRLGKIDDGSTTCDYDPEEVKRKISINTALAPLLYKDVKINLVDTPGYADFIGEVIGALKVVETALVVVDAVAGVEVQTEKVWHLAEEDGLSRIIFINRLDKENADFVQVVTSLKEIFGQSVIPVQIPIGKEASFKGIVDLLKMKAIIFTEGKASEEEIPADLASEAQAAREKLVEAAAEMSDDVLEKYLNGEELTDSEIATSLRNGVAQGKIFPVLCGSATKTIGAVALLDFLINVAASPKDKQPPSGTNPRTKEEVTREPSKDAPLSAFVFKTMADPYVGKLSYIRVYSGALHSDSHVYNATKDKKERIGHIFLLRGKTQEEATEVPAGDIATIPKLVETTTGDTICHEANPIVYPAIKFPEPLISVAIEPKTKGDEEKLSTSLTKLAEEDPTLHVERNVEIHQTIVSGVGDMHLEVVVDRLKRKFGVDAALSAPRIPYKETIMGTAKVQGKYKRQTGGRGQYGDVWLELEPLPRGGGFEFVDKIFGGAVPKNYIPSVEKGVKEAMEGGVRTDYPVVDVKVTIYDGSFHPVDSSDMAFKIAGSMAFKKGFLEARPVLLEPIMNVKVIVPEDYMGDVISDLSSKRAKIGGMEPHGRNQVVKALVPLAEMSKYATELRSITHGRGTYSMEFDHYEEVPSEIADRIIAQTAKKVEEE